LPGPGLRTMRRDPALVTLSHDHHLALYVARTLKRATAETASDGRAAFVGYWEEHGREHFRLEEEILLPAYAQHGDPHHPLVARALCDHVHIRARADALAIDSTPDPASLRELGTRLADHVRLEERQLFPLIEAALPTARLAAVAVALERDEASAGSAQGV
jgi:hemerythrin HHE cation binding domain-containing protein